MNNWYGKDRYNKDRNLSGGRDGSPENWTRRPSERYDREDYYRNSNPDHHSFTGEDNRWHFAGKFEDKNDPTYSYATRDRDIMPEYPTYPTNRHEFYQRHPDQRGIGQSRPDQRFGTQSGYGDDSSYYGSDGDFSNLRDRHYDQGYSRSQYGYPDQERTTVTHCSGDVDRQRTLGDRTYSQSYSGPSYAGRGPKGWKRSDESIKEQVCHALEQHPRIDASEIEIDVKEGVVTLRGNIHDRAAKRLAEDVIDWLPGVTDVHNNLTVDKTFFERAKEFFTGDSADGGAAETPSKAGKPEKNPRH